MKRMEVKKCILCGGYKTKGIILHQRYLCVDCEQEIVHTDVADAKYYYFIRGLRKLKLS